MFSLLIFFLLFPEQIVSISKLVNFLIALRLDKSELPVYYCMMTNHNIQKRGKTYQKDMIVQHT